MVDSFTTDERVPGRVGQLARRLTELATAHAGGAEAWQPTIDAVAALEGDGEHKRAHALFTETRAKLEQRHLADLAGALRAFAWLTEPPMEVAEWDALTERERQRAIPRLERALADARALDADVAEARRLADALEARAVDATADFARFERVPFADLSTARADAGALRRRLAAEARVEARAADLAKRARALKARRVRVPDVTRAAVPDAADAHAQLDAAEAALVNAEAVEAARRRALRELKDPSVRAFKGPSAKRLKARVDAAAKDADARTAAAALDALREEAAALREEAAALATRASKARKRGLRGPEKESSRHDADDPAYL